MLSPVTSTLAELSHALDLGVHYADEGFVVVEKPSGLLSVPGKTLNDSVIHRLRRHFDNAQAVHRLDMATSGLLIIALDTATERKLKRQFEQRRVEKEYRARVFGAPQQPFGVIDLPLICDWPNRPRQKVCFVHGKPSQTRYEVLSRQEGYSQIRLTPITGRSHQLRVHMMALGNPILGDEFYAHPAAFDAAPRLLLHAAMLAFDHPHSGERIQLFSPIPF
ncbi:pseudouridine synthase [Pokkaliibacter sp. CJK22405]|uniref:pseudouridine synthase n=1 Tax=Pokkaliibacter sp. CJK22405 TaxID=3384615 RepID=UPI003984E69D